MRKIISLLFIAFILISIWFAKGFILGAGEAGIPFYRFSNELSIIAHSWVEKGLGNPTGIVTGLYPYFYVMSVLQHLGISAMLLQAGLFFILLATGFLGMYILVGQFAKNTTIAFLAALFYNLNLFAMTIVWNRFQYPFMFFYAFMPLALYLFIRGLTERKIIFCFLLNLLSIIFVMVFASFPLLLLFWFTLGGYLLFFIATNIVDKRKILWSLCYFIACCMVFFFYHFWWIVQFLQTFFNSTFVTQQAYATADNFITFSILSERLGSLDYLMRLMHRDFFIWMQEVWGNIYQNPFMIFLSFLPLAFIFGSVFIKNKPKEYFFYLWVALIGIFFAKGSNDPFGGIFYFLFTHSKLVEAFRNPFEKIGLIIPLAYAPLFGYGVYAFFEYLKRKKIKFTSFFIGCIIFLICGVLVWPMWNGWLFTSNEPPTNNTAIGNSVKVPEYYEEANKWLNEQREDFRTIALPLKGEGITHTWEYGYNGVDLSSSLFDKPFLAFCTGLEYLCPITQKFQLQLFSHPEDFWKVLPPLNAKYVMVREDVAYQLRSLQSPEDIHTLLSTSGNNFSLEKQFDRLSFYKLKDNLVQPKITGATEGILFHSLDGSSFVDASSYADYDSGDIYIVDLDNELVDYEEHAKQILLKAQLFSPENLQVSKENAEAALPYIRFLPDSPFYIYSRTKEKFSRFLAGNNASREIVIESDKRLIEGKRLLARNEFGPAKKVIKEYQDYLNLFLKTPSLMNDKLNKMDLIRQNYVFSDILSVTKNNRQDTKFYEQTQVILKDLLYQLNIESKYPVDLTRYSSYKISVPEEGRYTLFFETGNWHQFYDSEDLEIVINSKDHITIPIDGDKHITEITFGFTKGTHQIDIAKPEAKNIVQTSEDQYTFETEQEIREYDFPFVTFDPLGEYEVTFDYYIDKGNAPVVFVTHDTDPVQKKKIEPFKSVTIDVNSYDRNWQTVSDTILSDPIAHTSKLVFRVSPWNDCGERNTGLLTIKCENSNFKNIYNRKTQVQVRNISVTKKLTTNLFLAKAREVKDTLSKPEITYSKINSATYKIDVKNASTPYFLTFLETFHPSWKAYVLDDQGKRVPVEEKKHFLINSFANGWYIEKKGNYAIMLEFDAEKNLIIGKIISSLSIIGTIIAMILFLLRKRYGNN